MERTLTIFLIDLNVQAPWPDSGYLRRDFESCVLEGDQECSWVEGQTFQDEEVILLNYNRDDSIVVPFLLGLCVLVCVCVVGRGLCGFV